MFDDAKLERCQRYIGHHRSWLVSKELAMRVLCIVTNPGYLGIDPVCNDTFLCGVFIESGRNILVPTVRVGKVVNDASSCRAILRRQL
jgi:hypothetical protein